MLPSRLHTSTPSPLYPFTQASKLSLTAAQPYRSPPTHPPSTTVPNTTMSSPSSAGSSKRKRTTNLAHTSTQLSTADLLQPSSRDASGEDAEDSTAQAVSTLKHKKSAPAVDSANPPTKRPRTRSTATAETATSNGTSTAEEDAGAEIPSRHKRKGGSSSSKYEEDADAEESEAMAPPGKGGLQDPVGYHTNLPPTGRAVRIYADGVFDLFHLGYVKKVFGLLRFR